MRTKQSGFAHPLLMLAVVIVIAAVGFAGYKVFSKKSGGNSVSTSAVNTAACSSPMLQSPADATKATSVLYPGQYRGGNYKAHGGLHFGNAIGNDVEVKAPLTAKLVDGARYTEQGETQILLDFKTDCGVNYRLDHLLTLAPSVQTVVDTLPAPEEENSMTHDFKSTITLKTGDLIATAIGFTKTHNVSFDFGVYDYRQPNEASKDSMFIAKHKSDPGWDMSSHAVCWLKGWLPAAYETALNALPGGDQSSGKTSDYCK